MIIPIHGVDELPQGPYAGSSVFVWTADEMRISLRLGDLDRLGCLFESVELKPIPGARLDVDPYSLGQKLGYLGEPLVVIEQAKEQGRAMLRSSPPSVDATHNYFFELTVDRDEGLSLIRYAYDRIGRERKMIAAPLTTHALGQLIDDLKRLSVNESRDVPSRQRAVI